ncbi:MAG: LysR family transcriptional regulator [Lysobacter sp.]|nr:LysR family transcriptional regulator [Lysobacter sp.]
MNFDDLRVFLTVVRAGTLQQAAAELHQTPSTLSRALRRLEQSLNTSLFDRAGKQLRLNADGQRLHHRALSLQREVEDTRAEFIGGAARLSCRLAGPAALLWRHAPQAAGHLTARYPDSALALQVQYEDAALQAVARGDADFALVTQFALTSAMTAGLQALELAPITMQLAAGANHPLLQGPTVRRHCGSPPRRCSRTISRVPGARCSAASTAARARTAGATTACRDGSATGSTTCSC